MKRDLGPITDSQIEMAFRSWQKYGFGNQDLEDRCRPLFTNQIISFEAHKFPWLKRCREAQMLSLESVACKLEITRASYANLEEREKLGTISLNKMAEAAEALDCELVVALRPKRRKLFSQIIWQKLLVEARDHHWVRSRPPKDKVRALLAVVRWKMVDSEFRLRHRWSKRLPQ